MDLDQSAPIGAVSSGSTLSASILDLSVMLCNYLQQMTSADDIFRCIFFLGLKGISLHTNNKDANHPVHPHSLISAFLYSSNYQFSEAGWLEP